MVFHSFEFILLFLPAAVGVYRILLAMASRRAANLFLIAASLVFYSEASWSGLPYLAGSMLANYFLARRMAASDGTGRRWWLAASLTGNILFLSFFKYSHLIPGGPAVPFPLGASFFTLQQIMYLMDTYEGLAAPLSLFDHLLFVSYFAYIAAGPITRPRQVFKQFHTPASDSTADGLGTGVLRFACGLFKKIVLADSLARMADIGFANANTLGLLDSWLFAFLYTLQLYFDFSGYSDMAIGVSRMFGIVLPENFDNPLRAQSISDFWKRWHITLTNFITTYLYTPILRSFGKVTVAKSAVATFVAMIISGMWHGSGWTFVIWGGMHGLALGVYQYWRSTKRKMPGGLGWALTFTWVVLALVFFRAPDLATARSFYMGLFGLHGTIGTVALTRVMISTFSVVRVMALVATGLAFFGPTSAAITSQPRFTPGLAYALTGLLLVSLLFLNSQPTKDFIYVAF